MHWHTSPYLIPTHQFRNRPNHLIASSSSRFGNISVWRLFTQKKGLCCTACLSTRESAAFEIATLSKILVHFLVPLLKCPVCQFILLWHAGCFTGHNLTPTASQQEEQSLLPSLSWVCWTEPQGCTVAVKTALGEGAESSSLCTELPWIFLQRSFPDKLFTELDFSIDCLYLLNC